MQGRVDKRSAPSRRCSWAAGKSPQRFGFRMNIIRTHRSPASMSPLGSGRRRTLRTRLDPNTPSASRSARKLKHCAECFRSWRRRTATSDSANATDARADRFLYSPHVVSWTATASSSSAAADRCSAFGRKNTGAADCQPVRVSGVIPARLRRRPSCSCAVLREQLRQRDVRTASRFLASDSLSSDGRTGVMSDQCPPTGHLW